MIADLVIPAAVVLAVDQRCKLRFLRRDAMLNDSPRYRRVFAFPNPASGRNAILLVCLWLFVLLYFVLVIRSGVLFTHDAARVALGTALGGAGSNLLDYIRRGGAVDYLNFGLGVVFNVADVAITGGVLVALALMW